jgi:dipeptidyl aminopeptidase/acylaminoacyl peptidase
MARVCGVLTFVLLAAACVAAQAPSKAQLRHEDAIRALFGVHEFQQAEISPDGKSVAWVESLIGPGGAPSDNSAIYIAEIAAPAARRRITAGNVRTPHAEHDLAWSPDSKRLAFLSDDAETGQLQLYVAGATGGPAKRLTQLKGYLSGPGWSPDGKTIAVLFTENATRAAGPLVAETPDEGVVSEEFYEQRLTMVDPTTRQVRQISPADMYVYEFDWSPDGKRLAVTAAHGNGDNNWYIAGLYTIDAASGAMRDVQAKPGMQIAVPRCSPDGRQIAFIGGLMSDEPIPGGDVYITPADGGAIRNLTPEMKKTATTLEFLSLAGSPVIEFTGVADGQTVVARVDMKGVISEVFTSVGRIAGGPFTPQISFTRDHKTVALVRESFSTPPEVWAGELANPKQITHRNADLKPAWGEAKSLHWKTEVGDVQGWLIYPVGFDPSKKYPLVVCVHGGPAWVQMSTWPNQWAYEFALPAEGYFLLLPNPRGSYGQGEKFTQANVKDFGYGDFRDILAGVDEAIRQAPVDPNRLGITGWSYGGYMTMWGVTQTNRFRAAVSGAGLSDWLSYYGENKIDMWMPPYFGASVYDDPAVYAKSSPITFIKSVKTPTLLVVGDRDGEVPSPQSYEFWHALKTLGVPTQFVIYPNEGHMFGDPAHSRDVIERTLAWFNQYLKAPN